jgi:hypothetical protein
MRQRKGRKSVRTEKKAKKMVRWERKKEQKKMLRGQEGTVELG